MKKSRYKTQGRNGSPRKWIPPPPNGLRNVHRVGSKPYTSTAPGYLIYGRLKTERPYNRKVKAFVPKKATFGTVSDGVTRCSAGRGLARETSFFSCTEKSELGSFYALYDLAIAGT